MCTPIGGYHEINTIIMQVWMGAILLRDYVYHSGSKRIHVQLPECIIKSTSHMFVSIKSTDGLYLFALSNMAMLITSPLSPSHTPSPRLFIYFLPCHLTFIHSIHCTTIFWDALRPQFIERHATFHFYIITDYSTDWIAVWVATSWMWMASLGGLMACLPWTWYVLSSVVITFPTWPSYTRGTWHVTRMWWTSVSNWLSTICKHCLVSRLVFDQLDCVSRFTISVLWWGEMALLS